MLTPHQPSKCGNDNSSSSDQESEKTQTADLAAAQLGNSAQVAAAALKLLLVDDSIEEAKRVAALARRFDLDVRMVHSVSEALPLLTSFRPHAVVTDKDMPDGSGNAVARAAKRSLGVPVLGITGGNPGDFDQSVVDVSLSKHASDELLLEVLEAVSRGAPAGELKNRFAGTPQDAAVHETLMAIDILVQAVILSRELRSGRTHIPGVRVPSVEEAQNLLNLAALDSPVSPHEIRAAVSALGTSPLIQAFAENVAAGKKELITLEQCEEFHRVFCERER